MTVQTGMVPGPRRGVELLTPPLSDETIIPYGRGELKTQFRVLSDADCAGLHRDAQIAISRLYAEAAGQELEPGEPSSWIETGTGQEQVWQEYRLKLVLEGCVYVPDNAGESGSWCYTLDEIDARAKLTADQVALISDMIAAHRSSMNPETWTPELVVHVVEDAKKNSPELISYGAKILATTVTSLVTLLPRYLITQLCESILNDSPLDMGIPGISSDGLGQLTTSDPKVGVADAIIRLMTEKQKGELLEAVAAAAAAAPASALDTEQPTDSQGD